MIFESERLLFKRPQAEHARSMTNAAIEVWPDLRKWMSWTNMHDYNVDHANYYINVICNEELNKGGLPLFGFCKHSGELVISTGLTSDSEPSSYTTGYWVAKKYLGKGYATEATLAVLDYAFAIHKAEIVNISFFEGNDKSKRIIEKCGFRFKQTLPKAHTCFADGKLMDEHCYEITNEQWNNSK